MTNSNVPYLPGNAHDPEIRMLLEWRDKRGHSSRYQFRAREELGMAVQAVIDSGHWPFKSQGDFYRLAAVEMLEKLADTGEVPLVVRQMLALAELASHEEYSMYMDKEIKRLDGILGQLIGQVYIERAHELVSSIRGIIEGMPWGFWQRRYQEEIEDIERRYKVGKSKP